MEITGVGEAAQFMEVSIRGIDTALRLTGNFVGWSLEQLCRLAKLIISQIERGKKQPEHLHIGEMRLDKMLSYSANMGNETLLMQIDEELTDDFVQFCKDNNLSYSFLYDCNKADGYKEIAYNEDQAAAFGVFIRKHSPKARAYSWNDYMENATEADFLEMEQEMSKDIRKQVERAYSSDRVKSFSDLKKKSEYMSVITISSDQYAEFASFAETDQVDHTLLMEQNDQLSIAVTDLDYDKLDQYLKGTSAGKQSLAEFLTEHFDFVPDASMMETAKKGSNVDINMEKDRMVKLDTRQLAEINEYAAKIRIQYQGDEAFVNIPLDMVYADQNLNQLSIMFPSKEQFHVVEEAAYTEQIDGQSRSILQRPIATLTGAELTECAITQRSVYEERRQALQAEHVKMADLFVNTPYDAVEHPIEPVPVHTPENIFIQPDRPTMHSADKQADRSMIQSLRARSHATDRYSNLGKSDMDITIDESLVYDENDRAVQTRIPGTWGENIRFLWIPKRDIQYIHGDQTILTRLEPDKVYTIYNADGVVAQHMKGSDLRSKHYDAIDKSVRKRAENKSISGRSNVRKKAVKNNYSRSRR